MHTTPHTHTHAMMMMMMNDNNSTQSVSTSFYEPPPWGLQGKPSISFHLEVIKDGEHIETIALDSRPYFVVGRQRETCHIVLDNPSMSRQHAILQYRQEDDGRLYVYDLKSTHGTFWNRKQIAPFRYVPLRIGDQLRFGVSSRVLVVGTSDERAHKLQESREEERERFVKRQGEKWRQERERLMREEERRQRRQERRQRKKLERQMKRARDNELIHDDDYDDDDGDDGYSDIDDDGDIIGRRMRVENEFMDNNALFDEDDEFYDRTLRNKKRRTAVDNVHDGAETKVETLDSLLEKRTNVTARLVELRKSLDQILQADAERQTKVVQSGEGGDKNGQEEKETDDADDTLERYMQGITSTHAAISRGDIEKQIAELEEERNTLNGLIEMARPAIDELAVSHQKNKFSEMDLFTPDMFLRPARTASNRMSATDARVSSSGAAPTTNDLNNKR